MTPSAPSYLLLQAVHLLQALADTIGAVPPSTASIVDTYVKIAGAVLTALATLIGLPAAFLMFRKTRAEIRKLELEADALSHAMVSGGTQTREDAGHIRIIVENSPEARIQILADPRFLAPLLVILDFVVATVVVVVIGRFATLVHFDYLGDIATSVLALFLYVPVARQAVRVRALLRPIQSPEEVQASLRSARTLAYAGYATIALFSLGTGAAMLTFASDGLTNFGFFLGWLLVGFGVLMIALAPRMRSRYVRRQGGG